MIEKQYLDRIHKRYIPMGNNSLTFNVGFGDWSNDGHGRTRNHRIKIDSPSITVAKLQESYQNTIKKLGFGLPELWADYEQTAPSQEHLGKMRKVLGLRFFVADENYIEALRSDWSNPRIKPLRASSSDSDDLGPKDFIVDYFSWDNALSLSDSGEVNNIPTHLRMAMAVVFGEIEDAHWSVIVEDSFLFGDIHSLLTGNAQVGYGLFD